MSEPIAIILAAGLGSRLAPLTDAVPKGLLPLDGRPLIGHSIDRLRAAGVPRIRVVTGYLHARMAAALAGYAEVEIAFNPDFAATGSLQSLRVGLRDLPSGADRILILESDLIYEARAIPELLTGPAKILTSPPTGAGDEVYVWAADGPLGPRQLQALSKDPRHLPDPPLGELTGLNVLRRADLAAARHAFDAVQSADAGAHYEDGLVAAARAVPLTCALLPGLIWAEIDDAAMLARAEARVWPAISRRDRAIVPG
jgi:2-aminoethylphosphonate-pyruvate transaminase